MTRDLSTHLSATYYRPSWQGGDVTVALCRRGLEGFWISDTPEPPTLTHDPFLVSCVRCLERMDVGRAAA